MAEDILKHYGMPFRSGRYKYGSGKDPFQSAGFLETYRKFKEDGLSETEIAEKLNMNTSELRTNITWANREEKQFIGSEIERLRGEGMSIKDISTKLQVSYRTVQNYKSGKQIHRAAQLSNVGTALKKGVQEHKYLDVGIGIEHQLDIPKTRLNAVINKMAKEDGYFIHKIYVSRQGRKGEKPITFKVLTKEPDWRVVKEHEDEIRGLEAWSDNGSETINNINPPASVNPDRLMVRYDEDGGGLKDGAIELRPGVADLDMGSSKYAQVRIKVGEDKYLKGMAVYGDPKDFPEGVDLIFNTNKSNSVSKMDALKDIDKNANLGKFGDNIFGGSIARQNDSNVLNIVNEEGDWDKWSKTLSSQFLSKQPATLIKNRLDATYKDLQTELDEIMSLDNEVVKDYLLEKFSDNLVRKASTLKAKGFNRSKSHVILPFPDMPPDQIFAPNYDNGDRVVLIRHPHGGKFEIPEVIVNNHHEGALRALGMSSDAIGLHPSVAEKLSGADFDGDTAIVIKNNSQAIKVSRSLKELKNFDPHDYKTPPPPGGYPKLSTSEKKKLEKTKNLQMGIVSNLITDMTLKGASDSEIAKAVKHSMVVIDSVKHHLDYRQSAKDNDIALLRRKYQKRIKPGTNKFTYGASTLISRAKEQVKIDEPDFDVDKLSSGTPAEEAYAGYVKRLQSTRNTVNKTRASLKMPPYSPEAARTYSKEVASLDAKVKTALLNAPRERQAQLLANKIYYTNVRPDMDDDQVKKLRTRSVARARATVGTKGKEATLTIEPKEWEAIQNRAISASKLKSVLKYADMDKIKQYSTPRQPRLSEAKIDLAKSMIANGRTYAEVSQRLGITVTSSMINQTKKD